AGGSMALGSIVAGAGRLRGLRRRLQGLDGHRILRLFSRLIIAALLASGIGFFIKSLLGDGADDPLHGLLTAAVAGLTMLAVYIVSLYLMRVQELSILLSPVTAKLRRRFGPYDRDEKGGN